MKSLYKHYYKIIVYNSLGYLINAAEYDKILPLPNLRSKLDLHPDFQLYYKSDNIKVTIENLKRYWKPNTMLELLAQEIF